MRDRRRNVSGNEQPFLRSVPDTTDIKYKRMKRTLSRYEGVKFVFM